MLASRVLLGARSTLPSRVYHYDLTIHGALFLSSTPPDRRSTITSYRDASFLRVLYARMTRNDLGDRDDSNVKWTRDQVDEAREARLHGYEWASHCQGELNLVRPAKDGSIVVFDDLKDGHLTFAAGSLSTPFRPDALRVSPSTGYLFHPSPPPPPASRRSALPSTGSRYGPYSLLRSSLVLEHIADSLALDDNDAGSNGGGSYEFDGKRYQIEALQADDVWRRIDR
ncbi:hypothetical protein JCM10212_003232 [Sporobolomyces blumeae]